MVTEQELQTTIDNLSDQGRAIFDRVREKLLNVDKTIVSNDIGLLTVIICEVMAEIVHEP